MSTASVSAASPAPDHDIRGVLAIKPFRALWLCLGASSLGDWLGLLATTSLAAHYGGQSSYAAANLAVSGVLVLRLAPAVLFGALAGAVADRWHRRTTMVVGDLLRAGLFVSIPLVGTLWWLLVATLLIEIVGLFWTPAKDASVPNLVPANRLEAANQLGLVVTYGTAPVAALLFVGFALVTDAMPHGGAALGGHVALALYADALTYLIAALVVARLRIPRPAGSLGASREAPPSLGRSIIEGWRFVAATPLVRGLVLGMLGAFAAGGFVIGVAPTFVGDLGGGEAGYGVLFGCVFAGLALGMWSGPRVLVALARWRLFALSLMAAGLVLALVGLVGHLDLVAVLTVAVGACGGVAWVTGYTLLGLEVADELRGRTFAFVQSLARIVLIAVIAAAPALAALIGEHGTRLLGHRVQVHGASVTLLIAGVVAGGIGLLAYRQLDDGSGGNLRTELVRAWRVRHSATPEPATRRQSGFFLAVEGGDGAGKSTQVRSLADWLSSKGYDVMVTREPGATAVGTRLRDLLLHGADGEALTPRAEALLYAADRAQHVDEVVRPALERGAFVVTDRYLDSSIAYQSGGWGLDAGEVARLSRWGTQDLVPDLTIVLDLPVVAARLRLGDQLDRLERQSEAFHDGVRATFLELARRAPRRYVVVDADAPPDLVAERVRGAVATRLPATPADVALRQSERAREEAEQAAAVAARAARLERVRAQRAAAREADRARRQAERARREQASAAAAAARQTRRAEAQAEAEQRAAARAQRDAERLAQTQRLAADREASQRRSAEQLTDEVFQVGAPERRPRDDEDGW